MRSELVIGDRVRLPRVDRRFDTEDRVYEIRAIYPYRRTGAPMAKLEVVSGKRLVHPRVLALYLCEKASL